MDDVMIREMRAGEAGDIVKGQRRAFGFPFSLFVSRPKTALVAVRDEKIVAAVTYKIITTPRGKVGYLDVAYTDAEERGGGLGSRLYKATMDTLKDQGCGDITATIRDDNRPSWKIMERNGAAPLPFYRMIKPYGLTGAVKLALTGHLPYALGHEMWVTGYEARPSAWGALPGFLVINALLMMLAFKGSVLTALGGLAVLAVEVAAGYLGTLGTRGRWYLQRPHGGLALSVFISAIQGLLPSIGVWQLKEDSYDVKDRAGLLGRSSLYSWIATLLMTAGSYGLLKSGVEGPGTLFLNGAVNLGFMLLIYRILALFPFESFGGKRVWDWNRWGYGVAAAASAAVVLWVAV